MQTNEFTDMIGPFKDKLYRLAFRIVKDPAEAQDVVQEVMIKVWKKNDYFQSLDNKEAWCMTLTKNLSIDKTRSKHKRNLSMDAVGFSVDRAANPHRTLESKDTLSHVKKLMDDLPEHYKVVIHLRDIEEMSYDEIAKVTGYNLDQVKIYLHRGRKDLRKKLLKLQR